MSALRRNLDDYLAIRRALGYKLQRIGLLLADFVAHMEANGADAVTTDAALAWASLPPNGLSGWRAQRLSAVRGFARHLHAIDPTHEVPPVGLLPGRSHRATPFPYSDGDIAALMDAARSLRSPLRAATFETLVGLLAVTGLRIGEALRLDHERERSHCTRVPSTRLPPTAADATSCIPAQSCPRFSSPPPAPDSSTATRT